MTPCFIRSCIVGMDALVRVAVDKVGPHAVGGEEDRLLRAARRRAVALFADPAAPAPPAACDDEYDENCERAQKREPRRAA